MGIRFRDLSARPTSSVSYYSKLYGDEEMTWGPDPLLTPLGHVQAADAHQAWLAEIPHGIPQPERHYVSPLKRALDTWAVTFGVRGISEDEGAFSSEKRIALVMEVCLVFTRQYNPDRCV